MPAIDHVRFLTHTIGPRGSTTRSEREAADYAARVLGEAGIEATIEPFLSARSGWRPSALFAASMLLGLLLFWFGGGRGTVAALLLSTLGLFSILRELAFRPNPIRWLLPRGRSQNVVARLRPSGAVGRRVVVIGHIDSHRTPLAFSTDGWLRLFQLMVPIGLGASVALILVFLGSAVFDGAVWRPLAIPFGLAMFGLFLITLQADFTPFTAGANDNASGAAVVLSLAQRLAGQPLQHTEVWVVLSGCEEVGCYGAEAFARAHRDELPGAAWLTLDSLGTRNGRPRFLTQERFLLTTRSDASLLSLAEAVARRRPELEARAHGGFSGAYTESAIGARHGFQVLTLLSLTPDGKPTEWHRPTDVVERMDPASVDACEGFALEFLQAFDRAVV